MIVFNDVITSRVAAEIVTEGGREGLGRREGRSAGDFVRPDGMGLPPEPASKSASSSQCLPIPSRGSSGTGEQNRCVSRGYALRSRVGDRDRGAVDHPK